jgi:hypothetical protein
MCQAAEVQPIAAASGAALDTSASNGYTPDRQPDGPRRDALQALTFTSSETS